jgi:hypothetical protein
MKSWKTTLGGALSAFGKTLFGVGAIPQLAGIHHTFLVYLALLGLIIDAIGDFFTKLFAADHATVVAMIQKSGGDTRWYEKEKEKPESQ